MDSAVSKNNIIGNIVVLCESCFGKIPEEPIDTPINNFPYAQILFRQGNYECVHCNAELHPFDNYYFIHENKWRIN
jgi:hypothetical protein